MGGGDCMAFGRIANHGIGDSGSWVSSEVITMSFHLHWSDHDGVFLKLVMKKIRYSLMIAHILGISHSGFSAGYTDCLASWSEQLYFNLQKPK